MKTMSSYTIKDISGVVLRSGLLDRNTCTFFVRLGCDITARWSSRNWPSPEGDFLVKSLELWYSCMLGTNHRMMPWYFPVQYGFKGSTRPDVMEGVWERTAYTNDSPMRTNCDLSTRLLRWRRKPSQTVGSHSIEEVVKLPAKQT